MSEQVLNGENLWVVTIFHHTEIPAIEHYQGCVRMKNGWKVRLYGTTKLIRNALERHFFTDETKLKEYLRRHVDHRIKWHKAMIEDLVSVVSNESVGTPGIPIRSLPPDRIFPKGKEPPILL